jgi:hypothetical protein
MPAITIGSARQLVFDDFFTDKRRGLDLTVNAPRKTGLIFLRADKPWESLLINAWFTLLEDRDPLDPSFRYRLWYEAYATNDDLASRLAYARSRDALHWEKPDLGLQKFGAGRHNNLVFAGALGHGQHGGSVFKDPTAPPEERYKYLYLAGGYCALAVSPDGLNWKPVDPKNDDVLHWPSDTQQSAWWDADLRRYVAFVRGWSPHRVIDRTESADVRHFPPPTTVLAADSDDPPDTDVYNNAAIKYPYAANAYFLFPSLYHHPSDRLWTVLVTSRDSVHLQRPSHAPFIPIGVPGSWDEGCVYQGLGMLRMGDELWLPYYGRVATHNSYEDKHNQGGYSYAVSRLDGFVSMDAGQRLGELVTRPLIFKGARLLLNIHTLPGGVAKVELQDEAGKPLRGFAASDCDEIRCDDVAQEVTWHGRSDVSGLAGKPVRLRFLLRRTKLFAFHFSR